MGQELKGRAFCVVGAATAGAEAAFTLAEAGADVVVLEQNARPFGKIEDGLPRWHERQREREYERIVSKLEHPRVHWVPSTRLGRDVSLDELAGAWGFDLVLLAVGAWRDRPLALPQVDAHLGRGILYQNPFVYWFNHYLEPDFASAIQSGPVQLPPEALNELGRAGPPDGALVVGGGLASIDVAKILMLETAARRLAQLGHQVDVLAMERDGLPKTLKQLGVDAGTLGLRGCTLVYRRRIEDMPVVSLEGDESPDTVRKIQTARVRLVEKAMEKFGFKLMPLATPEALLTEGDRVVGLQLRRTRMANGKLESTDEVITERAPLVVSSIGSIPEQLPGIPLRGELFHFAQGPLPRLEGFTNVFGVGNAVTGQGNIVASRRHAVEVAEALAAMFMGVEPRGETDLPPPPDHTELLAQVRAQIAGSPVSPQRHQEALRRMSDRRRVIDYADARAWLAKHGYAPG